LETQARLTELVGLTAEEGGKIAKFSAAAGMTNKDYVASLRRAAFSAMQTTKTHFSDKEILQDISKLSAGILVKFQNNPKAIAAAVVEAKKLGLTLDQVDKIGESILNFESSIESELKAELITGRQLNLERARAAALTGNQAELTREIAREVGSLNDFQNLNVIAQKSLAEAFGLSRDEMSEMLLKQEAINNYGEKAADLNAQQIKDMEKQGLTLDEYLKKENEKQDAQTRFNNAVQKLQDLLAGIVSGPIGGFIEGLAKMVEYTGILYPIVGAIGGIMVSKILFGAVNAVIGFGAMITKLTAINSLKAAGAVADAASSTAMGSQAISSSTIAATEGIITGEKVAGAAADVTSATAVGAQAIASSTIAATEGVITAEKVAGAAADVTSATSKGAQAIASSTIAATEGVITAEKVAQSVAAAIINPVYAGIGLALAGAVAGIIYGAVKKPQMAKGGIVIPTPGGTDVTVGEAGGAEAIIPLNSPRVNEMLGTNKEDTINREDTILSSLIAKFETTMMKLVDSNSGVASNPIEITTKVYLDTKEVGTSLVKLSPKAV
jgi:hypothetical protein